MPDPGPIGAAMHESPGAVPVELVPAADEPPGGGAEGEAGGEPGLVLRATRLVAEQPIAAEYARHREHRRTHRCTVEDRPRRAKLVVTDQVSDTRTGLQ